MTAICYDWEFLEDGQTIMPLSLGMVCEDGRELYVINRDFPLERLTRVEWLMENVVPHLPLAKMTTGELTWNMLHPDWKHVEWLAGVPDLVSDFIGATPGPELWAWYAAYDHVCLAQLWGRMINLPAHVPKFTHDLKQEAERLGNPDLPKLEGAAEHNALHDAREVLFRLRWLRCHWEGGEAQ